MEWFFSWLLCYSYISVWWSLVFFSLSTVRLNVSYICAIVSLNHLFLVVSDRGKGHKFRVVACLCWTTCCCASCWKPCSLLPTRSQWASMAVSIYARFVVNAKFFLLLELQLSCLWRFFRNFVSLFAGSSLYAKGDRRHPELSESPLKVDLYAP